MGHVGPLVGELIQMKIAVELTLPLSNDSVATTYPKASRSGVHLVPVRLPTDASWYLKNWRKLNTRPKPKRIRVPHGGECEAEALLIKENPFASGRERAVVIPK